MARIKYDSARMVLTSLSYLAFLACAVVLYWLSPPRFRKHVLLGFSIVFYATWNWRFLGLLALLSMVDFKVAQLIATAPQSQPRRSRVLLAIGLAANLSVLGAFKYYDFFVTGATRVLGLSNYQPGLSTRLLLPIGLSFFIFHATSYLVDVFRGEKEAESDLINVALYLSFFPHVLAGPISKSGKLIPQFGSHASSPSRADLAIGFQQLLLGFTRKLVGSAMLVKAVSSVEWSTSGSPLPFNLDWKGIFFFTIALGLRGYFDLASYSDIAQGSARLLGVRIPSNVHQPLTRSQTLADYWRRHHATLMGFFRDYIYRPIRGSGSPTREKIALALVFIASGLWHAFSPNAILFGIATAGVILGQQRFDKWMHRRFGPKKQDTFHRVIRTAIVWVLFASISSLTILGTAGRKTYWAMITLKHGYYLGYPSIFLTICAFVLMVLLDRFELNVGWLKQGREGSLAITKPWTRAVYLAAMIALILLWAGESGSGRFIYFRF